ncbi:putative nitrogen fixation protein NifT [Rhodoblastus sp.]|uniref:putative nitrogen fixation protein NifT n=1 Tax=Rhodoblastus sp. TaxID=1962975 RepID=UPI00261C8DD7|nr:putative nitrogen fixation protein NifT [Rhodoblastus sp.]
MKVMIRSTPKGLSVYVPKKDLEEAVVSAERDPVWGGTVTLKNGWVLQLPDMPADTRLPVTVEAKKLESADA